MSSRRWSGAWARPHERGPEPRVDVLIPTIGREAEFAVTLAGLAAQDDPPFGVIVSDQSDDGIADRPAIAAMLRLLEAQGRPVTVLRHLPRRGLAEQRQFLLDRACAEFVLYLDDDIWLEPGMLTRLVDAIETLGCGLVGSAVQGLSFLDDVRPDEQRPLEWWDRAVRPESIDRDSPEFARWALHNAANLAHVAAETDIDEGAWRAYRIAWVGGCCLFRRSALIACGGFDFWSELPSQHVGEDVVAQWRVMKRFGGAGLLPSGAVHLEAPTTIIDRNVEATEVVVPDRPHTERST
ncbi:glycosyltransferase [Paramicrobacterium agarici]|uniref:Glycosyl transferase family 2 n=1 Tax=Paramicrobacterium agarici TaxID=630514 RepID=A0A2A9E0U9_9MICO|nr:glycosyltransferase family 2 protein [Microbacterium agarici]PFG31800.1 glycosyl transferase family 2 [Microbacterium agarici]TQO21697.1 glycosyl transferase family 2 [Microbacterium agarici]